MRELFNFFAGYRRLDALEWHCWCWRRESRARSGCHCFRRRRAFGCNRRHGFAMTLRGRGFDRFVLLHRGRPLVSRLRRCFRRRALHFRHGGIACFRDMACLFRRWFIRLHETHFSGMQHTCQVLFDGKIFAGLCNCDFFEVLRVVWLSRSRDRFDGKVQLSPCIESSRERPHLLKSELSQFERHTGAGGFVRSTAIKNDLLFARYLAGPRSQLVRPQYARAHNLQTFALDLERMTKIDYVQRSVPS